MRKKTCIIFALLFFACAAAAQTPPTANAQAVPPYMDPSLPVEQRVRDLVSRMTLDEKASQMRDVAAAIPRLGVPAYNWWNEALHGVARSGHATVFPQAIGLAATWDTDLLHRVADVISTEARAKYNDAIARGVHDRYFGLTFWSPNINIFRDPRWGRGQETYGEDPFLTARMGVAFVTGLQGDDPKYLKTVSTPKHYGVHSGPEVFRHAFNVNVSAHDFEDTYGYAFRATVVEGKADSVMCAYNSVRGEPACASTFLLETLRNEWGFKGYVVSDCGAIGDIYRGHGFTMTLDQASAVAVKAGTDLSCGSEYNILPYAVANRDLSVQDVDRAVEHLFEARFRLGMFDPPAMVPWSKLTIADDDTPEHRAVALEAARESLVLLKNEHNTLPLKSSVKTIAVVGPNTDDIRVLLGNYYGSPSRYTTPLEGIRKRFSGARIITAAGAPVTEISAVPVLPANLRTGGANSESGLKAEFFDNTRLDGAPIFQRVDRQVDFFWDGEPPAAGVPGRNFSARWTGELVAPVSGEYRLGGIADDGFRLYLDGKLLVDDWQGHPGGPMTVPVDLVAGRAYAIRMEYFQSGGESSAQLLWLPPNLLMEAVAAARQADVVVAVVGITPDLESEEQGGSNPGFFGGDRVDVDLPRSQEQLLEALAATRKPLIVVLTSGSALAVNWAQEHAAAILQAWYPGEEGGAAIAEVLAGDYSPAGRLPVTFYKSMTQIPSFEDYSMKGRTYRYFNDTPLYPFGYGLSYTNFTYGNVQVDHPQIVASDEVTISADVKNTGAVAGDEVVELYLTHPDVPGAPIRALTGFTRVRLNGNEQKTVRFVLRDRDLSVVDESGKRQIVPGTVSVWIGGGQPVSVPGLPGPSGIRTEFRITSAESLPE